MGAVVEQIWLAIGVLLVLVQLPPFPFTPAARPHSSRPPSVPPTARSAPRPEGQPLALLAAQTWVSCSPPQGLGLLIQTCHRSAVSIKLVSVQGRVSADGHVSAAKVVVNGAHQPRDVQVGVGLRRALRDPA